MHGSGPMQLQRPPMEPDAAAAASPYAPDASSSCGYPAQLLQTERCGRPSCGCRRRRDVVFGLVDQSCEDIGYAFRIFQIVADVLHDMLEISQVLLAG